MNPSSRSLAALLFLAVPIVFAVGACSQQEPAAPEAPAAARVPGSAMPESTKPPLECSAATNAADCADILNHMGKDPAAAYGTPGHEPAYTDPDASKLPACKNGEPVCEAWERMWPQ
jgi:hypothetical protein